MATPSSCASWQTSVKKFYDGAAEFDGSSYLEVAGSSAFVTAGKDFSCEFWLHPTTLSGDLVPLAVGGSGSSNQYFITSTGSVYLFYGQSDQVISPVGSIGINQWQHCAVSRISGHLRVFVNGSIVASATNSASEFLGNTTISIGRRGDAHHHLTGYMQDLRIYPGIGKYSSSFTPPERSVQGTARRYPSGIYVVS